MMGLLVGYWVVAALVGVRVTAQLLRDGFAISRRGEWNEALVVSTLLTFAWPVMLLLVLDDWMNTYAATKDEP